MLKNILTWVMALSLAISAIPAFTVTALAEDLSASTQETTEHEVTTPVKAVSSSSSDSMNTLSVTLSDDSISVGQTAQITAEATDIDASTSDGVKSVVYSYSSSDTSIAKVSSKGVITAKEPGTVTITVMATIAKNSGNKTTLTATITLTVQNLPDGIQTSTTTNSDGTLTYNYYVTTDMVNEYLSVHEKKGFRMLMQAVMDLSNEDGVNYYSITVQPGTYYLNAALYIYGHTTLNCTGSTIQATEVLESGGKTYTHWLIRSGKGDLVGYDDNVDVTIIGGTWDGNASYYKKQSVDGTHPIFQLAHTTNLTVRNVTFQNQYGNHHLEIAACKDVVFNGCTFTGITTTDDNATDYAREALQIDVCKTSYTGYYLEGQPILGCVNFDISGCTFYNVAQGIGSHKYTSTSYSNINIHDNVFYNLTLGKHAKIALHLYEWKNSAIYNNRIILGAGSSYSVLGSAIVVSGDNSGTNIYSNTINATKYCGISVGSGASIGKIYNNQITTTGKEGIYVLASTVAGISGNTITNASNEGVEITSSSTVSYISENVIKSTGESGIYVNSSTVKKVANNTIKSTGYHGINLEGGAVVKTITGNKITSAKKSGIAISGKSTVTKLTKNTITSSKKYGISVTGYGKVTNLSKNTVKGAKKTSVGIYVKNATITKMLKNKLQKCKKYGVQITGKSKVKKFGKTTYTKCKKKYKISKKSKVKKVG